MKKRQIYLINDDTPKRHKDNSLELCGFLNKEYCIAQMNNSSAIKKFIRDDDRRVSTQPLIFLKRLKLNEVQVLTNFKKFQKTSENLYHHSKP